MNNILTFNDTICAIATPCGGAIAIIRLSGEDAIKITSKCFKSVNNKSLEDVQSHTLHYGSIIDENGKEIDEVLVSVFRAPHSYTSENATEISFHGSQYIAEKILQTLFTAGARQATAGEFTQRAFLNGKLDLSQAEAVADMIAVTNRAQHIAAFSQLKGSYAESLKQLRERLLHLTSLLELELDFSDHEELEFADRTQLRNLTEEIKNHIESLTKSFSTGEAIKNGIPLAIIGNTNVGKSTLLNVLLQENRAIVSDIHGTTRDTIEQTTQINGLTFRLIDTAGIRETNDAIERLGIDRTYQKIDEATIILYVTDHSPNEQEIASIKQIAKGKKLIFVINKIDLHSPTDTLSEPHVNISALHNTNIDELKKAIYEAAAIPEIQENTPIVTNLRHYEALKHALDSINNVKESFNLNISADLIAEDFRDCISYLGEITGGTITSQDVLTNIFSHFCVGK